MTADEPRGPEVGVRHLLHVAPGAGTLRPALRAGTSVAVPLLVVLALGHPEWALYAVFGAFTAVYGRSDVGRGRLAVQAGAGLALTLTVVLGTWESSWGASPWAAVVMVGLVAVLATWLAAALSWRPPGPLFLVFAFGATSSVPHQGRDVAIAALVAGATTLLSLVVGAVGGVVRRAPSTQRPAPVAAPLRLPLVAGLAVAAAGGLSTLLGIGHPYWASVAAAAPLGAQALPHQLLRAAHRVLGTLVGLVVAALLLALGLPALPTVLVVVVLQVGTELLVGRNYGLAMVLITPMALLMGQLAAPRGVATLLLDRGVETALGAAVAVVLLLAAERHARPARRRPA